MILRLRHEHKNHWALNARAMEWFKLVQAFSLPQSQSAPAAGLVQDMQVARVEVPDNLQPLPVEDRHRLRPQL
ncbi:hypothetical protein VF09_37080 [Nostoc linckia z9]|nr:hypothetical protein VF09_37080 [Nostoc linckia z9]